MEGKPRTEPATEQAKHQSHDQRQAANLLASPAPKQRLHLASTPTHLSSICSPHWKTINRPWLPRPQCNSSTHNRLDSINHFNSKASSNRPFRCLNSSSPSCHKTHKAPIHSRCNSSSNLNNINNYSHSLRVQVLVDTHLSHLVPKTVLHQYLKTACRTSRNSNRCSFPLSLSQFNNNRHQPIRSVSLCCQVRQVRPNQSSSTILLVQARSVAPRQIHSRNRLLASNSNYRHRLIRHCPMLNRPRSSRPHLHRNNKCNHPNPCLRAPTLLPETHLHRMLPHLQVASQFTQLEAQILSGKARLSTSRPGKAGKTRAAAQLVA